MKRRIPTLDEFIMENDSAFQLYEGKFNWDAKKLSAAWNKNQPDVEEPYEPSNPEVTIWVALTNLMNLHKAEPIRDCPDEYSIMAKTKDRVVGVYSEMFSGDMVTMTFNMVKPDDIDNYDVEDPMEMNDAETVYTETVTYDLQKLNARAVVKQIEKVLKKLFVIL